MSKVRVELNLPGVNALMKGQEIQAALQAAGEAVAAAAGAAASGAAFGARTHTASWVAITNVYPESREALRANIRDNVLLKALGSAGLKLTKGAGR